MKRMKNLIRKNEGVSLISLSITLVIMILIIGTVTFNVGRIGESQKVDSLYNGLTLLSEKVNLYYIKYGKLPIKQVYSDPLNLPEGTINPNDGGEYYVLDISALDNVSNVDEDNVYIINENSHTIYALQGEDIGDETVNRLPEEYAKISDEIKLSYELKAIEDRIIIYANIEEAIEGLKSVKFDSNEEKSYEPNTKFASEIFEALDSGKHHIRVVANDNRVKEFEINIIGYTVTYNTNGGTGEMNDTSFISGIGKRLEENVYTRTGYTFSNWNTESDGTGRSFNNTEYVKDLTEEEDGEVTLYAQWNPNQYEVSLNNEGAASAGTTTIYERYDTGYFLDAEETEQMTTTGNIITVPSKRGYTFAGYYTSQNGEGTQYIDGNGNLTTSANTGNFSENGVLYAKWNINTYTVTYNYATNGGSSATKETARVNYTSSIDLAPTATKSGWTFVGWNTDQTATTPLTSLTMDISDVTLYAIYSKTLTATLYTYNNQSTTKSATIYNTETSASINLGTTSLSGYTFRGWSTSNSADATISVVANGNASIASNTTYYASYTYTITNTYYAYYGSYTSKTATATGYMNYTGSKVGGKPTAPSVSNPSGWSGRGWSTSNGANASVATPGIVTGNTTYYYSWSKSVTATLKIYNNASGGTKTGTAYLNYKGDTTNASIALGTTSLSGYSFRGWSTGTGATSGVVSNNTASINTNTTFYASYSYTVTIKYSGNSSTSGSTPSNSTGTAYMNYTGSKSGASIKLAANPFSRTGYTYGGWNTATAGNGTNYSANTSYTLSANATLYAKWTGITYYIKFNGNGNTGGSTAQMTMTYGTAKNLTSNGFSKSGYSWNCWRTSSSSSSGTKYTNGQSVNNLTTTNGATVNLYAIWYCSGGTSSNCTGPFNKCNYCGGSYNMSSFISNSGTFIYCTTCLLKSTNSKTCPSGHSTLTWNGSQVGYGAVTMYKTSTCCGRVCVIGGGGWASVTYGSNGSMSGSACVHAKTSSHTYTKACAHGKTSAHYST